MQDHSVEPSLPPQSWTIGASPVNKFISLATDSGPVGGEDNPAALLLTCFELEHLARHFRCTSEDLSRLGAC